jgi:peptidoglycan/LPS O-acetylase OafA/YrhL
VRRLALPRLDMCLTLRLGVPTVGGHATARTGEGQPWLIRLYGKLSIEGSVATGHERLGSVDLIRATAALSVLLAHAYSFPTWSDPSTITRPRYLLTTTLSTGVYLFFAVSGYLIAGPYLRALVSGRRPPSRGGYALRRSVRILPAWWVALIAVILLTDPVIELWQLFLHVTLTFGPDLSETQRYLSIGWTLGVEALFYAFVPLATALAIRVGGRRAHGVPAVLVGVAGLWVASGAWSVAAAVVDPLEPHPIGFLHGTVHTGLGLFGGLFHFAPGMLVFVLLLDRGALPSRVERAMRWAERHAFSLLALAGVIWLAGVAESHLGQSELRSVLLGEVNAIACGMVLLAVLTGAPRLRRLTRVAAPLGLVSYGIYLWHGVIIDWLAHHQLTLVNTDFGPMGFAARSAALLVPAVALGVASWIAIERPLLRRTAGWEKRRTSTTGDDAVPAEPALPLG